MSNWNEPSCSLPLSLYYEVFTLRGSLLTTASSKARFGPVVCLASDFKKLKIL